MTSFRHAQVVSVAALTALAALPAQAQQSAAVAAGASVYGSMCGRCHNPRSPLERSDRDWVTITNHMRVRANLTGEQVRDVLAFLQATNSDPAGGPTPQAGGPSAAEVSTAPPQTDAETVARGRTLALEKGCIGCHVIGGMGGQVGPSLHGVVSRRSPADVRRKLRSPTFDNRTSMMPNLGLSADEIEALLAYLATLSQQ